MLSTQRTILMSIPYTEQAEVAKTFLALGNDRQESRSLVRNHTTA